MPPSDPTYPPLDTPKPVADRLWVVDSGPLHMLGLRLPVRMTVARLEDGGLWVHSPTRCEPGLRTALEAIGPVRHLVAPNSVHTTYLAEWQGQYPRAQLWGAPSLADRQTVRRQGLRFDGVLGEAAPSPWQGQIDQVVVPGGGGFHEVAFLHRPSRTAILTDLVQAFEPQRLPAVVRPMVRAMGTMAPEGGTPRHLRAVLALKHADAKAAARRITAWAPQRVIFAHGTWFAENGAARLARAMHWAA
ncbi:DUF4336 domain-containing protein [Pseudoroseomonas globiformis]|uniref:DUF4336 domain-containing protein n=1 Tax=Teichococcus globiformis TaxID=2307229 RepID=A0ABV7FYW3_9PROT